MRAGCISLGTVPQAGALRAQVRSFKRAWLRGRSRGWKLLDQLLHHMSIGIPSASRSARATCRMPHPTLPFCVCAPHISSVSNVAPSDVSSDIQANQDRAAGCLDATDDDDHLDSRQIRPASNFLISSLASCCFRVHYMSYKHLANEESTEHMGVRTGECSVDSSCLTHVPHDSNPTVVLKVSIVGDANTGKTSFMAKYVCPEEDLSERFVETVGVATEEKIVRIKCGANIAFNIWDLGGHWQSRSMVPLVCRDAVAILIMFDLTRRSTLNSVNDWFAQARDYNKAAIPVLIGTKFDQFVEFPDNIQLAIIQQARGYAKAMEAPLFFSSVVHNINVHKVFKVIVAKLLDIPCPSVPLNLTFGEPLVDY